MAVYSFKMVQEIPVSLEKAWDFFSQPSNLAAITPGDLGFKVISKQDGREIYAGQLIEYRIKPVLGISLYWMTEITQCERHRYFVDEQRFGPYAFWHHEHHFKADNSLTEMTDIVYYKVRFGPLGDLANGIFVRKKLKAIFDFRRAKIEVLFERK